jgi:HlyD family secretion protein
MAIHRFRAKVNSIMSKKRLWIVALAVVILSIAVWLAWRALSARSQGAVAVVRRGSIAATVDALGKVQPVRTMTLSLRQSGSVARIHVLKGAPVAKGQLLLELDPREYQDGIAQAERYYELRRLQLEQLLEAPSSESIVLARARLQRATAARLNAQTKYDDLTTPDRESSDEALALEIAKLEYEVAKAEFDRVLRGPSELDVLRARLELQDAELSLAQARNRLELSRLYAPWDGVCLALLVQEGDNVYGGSPLVQIASLAQMQIRADIDEIDIVHVSEGQAVSIRLDAFPGELLEGRVQRIAPAATEGRGVTSYEALIALEETRLGLRPGMGANLTITTQEVSDALLVPRRAVREVGRFQVAKVLVEGRTREVTVVTGLSNQNDYQILSGLEEGQLVALD